MGTVPWAGEGDTVPATLSHGPPGDRTVDRVLSVVSWVSES